MFNLFALMVVMLLVCCYEYKGFLHGFSAGWAVVIAYNGMDSSTGVIPMCRLDFILTYAHEVLGEILNHDDPALWNATMGKL